MQSWKHFNHSHKRTGAKRKRFHTREMKTRGGTGAVYTTRYTVSTLSPSQEEEEEEDSQVEFQTGDGVLIGWEETVTTWQTTHEIQKPGKDVVLAREWVYKHIIGFVMPPNSSHCDLVICGANTESRASERAERWAQPTNTFSTKKKKKKKNWSVTGR